MGAVGVVAREDRIDAREAIGVGGHDVVGRHLGDGSRATMPAASSPGRSMLGQGGRAVLTQIKLRDGPESDLMRALLLDALTSTFYAPTMPTCVRL
jgi:hypothetical protein